jgi:hypothetical protein
MAVTPLRRLSTMAICNYVRYKRSGLRAAENCNLNTSLLAVSFSTIRQDSGVGGKKREQTSR